MGIYFLILCLTAAMCHLSPRDPDFYRTTTFMLLVLSDSEGGKLSSFVGGGTPALSITMRVGVGALIVEAPGLWTRRLRPPCSFPWLRPLCHYSKLCHNF